jgi:hypothetical protein
LSTPLTAITALLDTLTNPAKKKPTAWQGSTTALVPVKTMNSNPYRGYLDKIGWRGTFPQGLITQATQYKFSLSDFDALLRQKYTTQYLKSNAGGAYISNYRHEWQTYFPGALPPKSGVIAFTQGNWNANQAGDYIQKTAAFKQQYINRGFQYSGQLQNSPQNFEKYANDYANTMREYNMTPSKGEYSLFFGGNNYNDMTTFKNNVQSVMDAGQAYKEFTGESLSADQQARGIYSVGKNSGQDVRDAVVNSYNARQSFDKSNVAQVGTNTNQYGALEQSAQFAGPGSQP